MYYYLLYVTSVGFCPKDLITVPNSFVVIVPSPSYYNKYIKTYLIYFKTNKFILPLSNIVNASRNPAFSSS